jgi:hypothetical protein
MGFETVYGELTQRQLEHAGKGQTKVNAKLELKAVVKKVLSASATCYISGAERNEAEVKISGKVVTRVIFVDEFDAFNSEERTDTFAERVMLKNHADIVSFVAQAAVLETQLINADGTGAEVESIVDFGVMAVREGSIRFVSDAKGDAEVKKEQGKVSLISKTIEDKFEVGERVELDKNCEGILGVDSSAVLRDIDCGDGRITLKGTASVNVIAVKMGETATIYNTTHEFDFTKVVMTTVRSEDLATGCVAISNVNIKAENRTKPELVVALELMFSGNVVTEQEFEYAADVISFENELSFAMTQVKAHSFLQQYNGVVDVEGNITMPDGAAYISKMLSVSSATINSINIVPTEDKVTIEGVLAAAIVYECDEKQIQSHTAQIPFTSTVKVDGITVGHNIAASVVATSCNIKARRGKELLVDARLGIALSASTADNKSITGEITAGDAKAIDDAAIMVYLVRESETLWDIAKRTNVSSAEIIKQNAAAGNGVAAGDKLMIYRQHAVSF